MLYKQIEQQVDGLYCRVLPAHPLLIIFLLIGGLAFEKFISGKNNLTKYIGLFVALVSLASYFMINQLVISI